MNNNLFTKIRVKNPHYMIMAIFISATFLVAAVTLSSRDAAIEAEERAAKLEQEMLQIADSLLQVHAEYTQTQIELEVSKEANQRLAIQNQQLLEKTAQLEDKLTRLQEKLAKVNEELDKALIEARRAKRGSSSPARQTSSTAPKKEHKFQALADLPYVIPAPPEKSTERVETFFTKYAPMVKKVSKEYRNKVPYEITLAQMALESGWGKSELFRKVRNAFGLTYKAGGDKSIVRNFAVGLTSAQDICPRTGRKKPLQFAIFADVSDGVKAHQALLLSTRYSSLQRSRPMTYSEALKIGELESPKKYWKDGKEIPNEAKRRWEQNVMRNWNDPVKRWAHGLEILGYAEDNGYGAKVLNVVQSIKKHGV